MTASKDLTDNGSFESLSRKVSCARHLIYAVILCTDYRKNFFKEATFNFVLNYPTDSHRSLLKKITFINVNTGTVKDCKGKSLKYNFPKTSKKKKKKVKNFFEC